MNAASFLTYELISDTVFFFFFSFSLLICDLIWMIFTLTNGLSFFFCLFYYMLLESPLLFIFLFLLLFKFVNKIKGGL